MATRQPLKPSPPAFLNWKLLRRWSVGRRAPSLCKLFYNARSSPKVGLVMVGKILGNIKSSSSTTATATSAATTTTTTTTVTEASASRAASAGKAPASPPRALQVQLSAASNAATAIKRSISYSNNNSSTPVLGAMALANCLRRKSDAIAPPPRAPTSYRRFSVDSHPYTAAYHLSSDNHDQQVPKILRLGSSSAASAQAAERSIMFMGSPAVAKVKETCARILTVAAQHNAAHHHPVLLGDLFVGNPFLTRVNPAPVSSSAGGGGEEVTPSFGLLDASVKCRDSELKDRIVFFL